MQSSRRLAGSQSSDNKCWTSIIISSLCSNVRKLCCKKPEDLANDTALAAEEKQSSCTNNVVCRGGKAALLLLACPVVTFFTVAADAIQCACSPISNCVCRRKDSVMRDSVLPDNSYARLPGGPNAV